MVLLEIEFTKAEGFHKTGLLGVFNTQIVHTYPLEFVNCSLAFPTLALVLMGDSSVVSYYSVCLPFCLLNFRSSSMPCDLISPKDLRRVIDFSVCSNFYC